MKQPIAIHMSTLKGIVRAQNTAQLTSSMILVILIAAIFALGLVVFAYHKRTTKKTYHLMTGALVCVSVLTLICALIPAPISHASGNVDMPKTILRNIRKNVPNKVKEYRSLAPAAAEVSRSTKHIKKGSHAYQIIQHTQKVSNYITSTEVFDYQQSKDLKKPAWYTYL